MLPKVVYSFLFGRGSKEENSLFQPGGSGAETQMPKKILKFNIFFKNYMFFDIANSQMFYQNLIKIALNLDRGLI